MEPKLIRKDIKYQKKTLAIVSVLVISLFIGGSFALLSSSSETGEVVTFKTGKFDLEASMTSTLNLDGEVPKSYDDGFKNNDITLTLTNKGTLEIGKYEVKLEGDTGTTLDANYIRYSVSDDDGKTYLASKLLSETDNIIYTGYNLKDTKVLKVKLWIDEDAGEAALKKSYNGKINVELYQNDDTLVDVVKSKLVSNYSGSKEDFNGGLVAVNNDNNLYHETNSEEIREYRYSGPNVNNYVTFNDELWRIIGVFKDENNLEHIKIVKNQSLGDELLSDSYKIGETIYNIKNANETTAFWNNKTNGINNNDWATAGLQYFLNTTEDETEGEPNKGYLNTLKSDSLSMIEETKYYLGGTRYIYNTIDSYTYERATDCANGVGPAENNSQSAVEGNASCRVWIGNKATWIGKVALLYPSDYGFTANNNYWNGTGLHTYNNAAAKTSWLKQTANHTSYEWFLSPTSTYSDWVTIWSVDNNVGINILPNNRNFVRPTLYLKTNVKITSGTGEESNPYKLSLD